MKKNISIKLFIFWSFFFGITVSFAQQSPILGNFSLYKNKGAVYLNWQIISGSTCNGIQIFRSTDTLNFTQIGSIAGICGSSSQPINYDFKDINPEKNKINYYRIELGNTGSSEIISVEIIEIESGFQIRPNPVFDFAKIYFDNNISLLFQLDIYNLNGEIIFTDETKKDFFELDTEKMQSGIYFFTIGSVGNVPKAKGRIMVQH